MLLNAFKQAVSTENKGVQTSLIDVYTVINGRLYRYKWTSMPY